MRKAKKALPCPKRGPGQLFVAEFVDGVSGHARRFRNVQVTPLQALWYRGSLESPLGSLSPVTGDDRLAAGEIFERAWYILHRNGICDSTERVAGEQAGGGLVFSEARADAMRRLGEIARRMQATNYLIVAAFCGEQMDLPGSLRRAGVDVHVDGRAYRLREALDDLVSAITGWRVDRFPET